MAFELGKWLVICDRCGFQRKNDQVLRTWDNLIVCAPSTGKTCFETRHPQEFVKGKKDDVTVPFVRPQPALLDGAPAINCSTAQVRNYSGHFTADTTIIKGYMIGPMIIDDGVTVAIECEMVVA